MKVKTYEHLIVGNSAAGIGAAEVLGQSRVQRRKGICVISEERGSAYARPFIGHLVEGTSSAESLNYRSPTFYRSHGIELHDGQRATGLDLENRLLTTDAGEEFAFHNLLVATGGSPIIPPIDGLGENAVTFSSLRDAQVIRDEIGNGVRSAIVLGGGLIGTAATSALVERGVEVTLVELAPRVLSTVLDEDASSIVQKMIDASGVRTILGHTISSVVRNGALRADIDNGESIEADMLIAAIGVRPRVELVKDTEVAVDRGIIVNERMETSVPGVYAAGDCSQVYDSVRERKMVLALWPTAYMGGMVAGRNMGGDRAQLEWTTSMNSMNYFGIPVLSAGIVAPPQEDGWKTIAWRNGQDYRRLNLREGIPKGFILVGEVDRAGLLLQMMRAGTPLSKLKEDPLSPGFGLAHIPTRERRRMWREATRVA